MLHFDAQTVSMCKIYFPISKHIVGKLYKKRIDREHLTRRTRFKQLNRKTIGY
ncbi:IS1 family transposase [Candidatus Enterovibrio escicola]|uniref:IS1 family transposase n=1 Tax=Candidatus Enterovibrio escicola TaxID=1927127 RepID=UPI000BE315F0